MRLALNGEDVTIYKIKADAELHPWRNRYRYPEEVFEVLKIIEGQVHWYSKESIQKRQELGYFATAGAVVIRTGDAEKLGILPVEEEWAKFRVKVNSLGTRTYEISEVRPICPLRSHGKKYLFRKIFISEPIKTIVLGDIVANEEETTPNITQIHTQVEEEVL